MKTFSSLHPRNFLWDQCTGEEDKKVLGLNWISGEDSSSVGFNVQKDFLTSLWYINILGKITCFKLVYVRLLEYNDCWGFFCEGRKLAYNKCSSVLMWNELLLQKLQGWGLVCMCREEFPFWNENRLSLQKARRILSVLQELPRSQQCQEASKIWGLFWSGWRERATGKSLSSGRQSSGVDFECVWNLCGDLSAFKWSSVWSFYCAFWSKGLKNFCSIKKLFMAETSTVTFRWV